MELLVFLRVLMMKSDEFGDGDSCKRKKTNRNETMVLRLREDPAAAGELSKFWVKSREINDIGAPLSTKSTLNNLKS